MVALIGAGTGGWAIVDVIGAVRLLVPAVGRAAAPPSSAGHVARVNPHQQPRFTVGQRLQGYAPGLLGRIAVGPADPRVAGPDARHPGPLVYLDVEKLDVDMLAGVEDEVDRLVTAWRQLRPDLDVSPLEVLSRVSRLARHLDRTRRHAFAAHALAHWEFDVLAALRRSGAPYRLSPGALLSRTLVTSGTMTNRIDRLAARGLVHREPDPHDRRGVLVVLTEDGLTRVDSAFSDLLDHERRLLQDLTQRQRDTLAGMLRTLVTPFDNL